MFSWYPSFTCSLRDTLCAWTHTCGWKECEIFSSPFLQPSWAGTGSCWNPTICSSSGGGGADPPAYKVKTIAEILKHINLVRSSSKTFEGICSHFPQMFLCKKHSDEVFIFRIKYSLVHEPGEFFGSWKGWNSEEKNSSLLLQ